MARELVAAGPGRARVATGLSPYRLGWMVTWCFHAGPGGILRSTRAAGGRRFAGTPHSLRLSSRQLKYRDGKGVGVFDFDWAKIDYRLFDVALALVYFCSDWARRDTRFRKDKFILFLSAYNEASKGFDSTEALLPLERQCLIPMLDIANLYLLHWELVDFFGCQGRDDKQYYRYLEHTMGLMHWVGANEESLQEWVVTSAGSNLCERVEEEELD